MASKRASDLQPGMVVLRGRVATPDAWVPLGDPALERSAGGNYVELLYADGSRSQPMRATAHVEYREPLPELPC